MGGRKGGVEKRGKIKVAYGMIPQVSYEIKGAFSLFLSPTGWVNGARTVQSLGKSVRDFA